MFLTLSRHKPLSPLTYSGICLDSGEAAGLWPLAAWWVGAANEGGRNNNQG